MSFECDKCCLKQNHLFRDLEYGIYLMDAYGSISLQNLQNLQKLQNLVLPSKT